MKYLLKRLTNTYLENLQNHVALLVLRVCVSVQLIVVHGFKKLGIGVEVAEIVPNPLGIPDGVNQAIAIAANIIFPILVICGFMTRLAVLPILAVTLTGYFLLHAHDSLLIKDIPFMYSLVFLYVFVIGPGKFSMDYSIHKNLEK